MMTMIVNCLSSHAVSQQWLKFNREKGIVNIQEGKPESTLEVVGGLFKDYSILEQETS